jgi:hypothetical protein
MSRNPYQVTKATLIAKSETVEPNRLYSPRQATMASFFGGPFAAIHVVRSNYKELGNDASFRAALLWGALFVVILLLVLPFLPEKFPNTALPVAYSLAVGQLVEKHQMTKDAIQASETYEFHSNWRVAGIAAVTLLIFLAVSFAWMFVLAQFGLITI